MKIEHIVVINLKDKIHRWAKFYDIHPNIERFNAVDSRNDFRVCEKYGLKLDPVSVADKLYFSQTSGSVGAYCSHYLVWKHILNENWNNALILEDDAYTDDVKTLLDLDLEFDDEYDVHQLNKRWHHSENFHMNFDGLESYIVTNRGAKILIEATHERTHFNGKVTSGPYGKFKKSKLENVGLFKSDENQNWGVPNIISCAVDKFVGFCANPQLPSEKRIKIKFEPRISVYEQRLKSDIEVDGVRSWHECSEYELLNFIDSPYYEYWNRGFFLSPNHIPRKRIKFSFLTSSMNRCDDLKQTYIKNIETCLASLNVEFEFVLLNYNSSDDIDEWVTHANFGKMCNFVYLNTKKHKYFNMSVAKNILGKSARGEILCWLDSDNILTSDYLTSMNQLISESKNNFVSVEYDKKSPGICGRIACYREDFYEVNGYDESFEGWGYEDVDFTNRLKMINRTCKNVSQSSVVALNNSDKKRFENYKNTNPGVISENSSFSGFRYVSNLQNFAKSRENILNGKFCANENFPWGQI